MRWIVLITLACLSFITADRNVAADNIIARLRYGGGINVAVKGAYATTGNTPDNSSPWNFTSHGWTNTFWDISQQVDHIVSINRAYPIANDSIHVVWLGINDLYRNGLVDVASVVSSIDTQIHRIWNETTARQFVLFNIHDLTQTPAGKQQWNAATATSVQLNVVAFNAALSALVTKLNVEGASAVLVDANSTISTLAQNASYNSVAACYNRATGAVCPTPSTYLYWDDIHLTSAVARQLADAALTQIQSTFNITSSYQWFMYGDDSSDQGNNDAVAQTFGLRYPIQPAPYNGTGMWSDAGVMPTYLGELLSAPLSLSHATRVIPLQHWRGGVNFATGGSMTSASINGIQYGINIDSTTLQLLRLRSSPVPWSFQNEINQGVVRNSAGIKFHPDALHLVWIGGNDYLHDPPQTNFTATALAVVNHIKDIYTRIGATRFLIGLMPNFALTPAFKSKGAQAAYLFGQIAQGHNMVLQAGINQWAAQTPGVQIAWMDAFSALNNVVANYSSYGFTNSDTPCFNLAAGTLCANAFTNPQYIFWDTAHPTTQAHALMANLTYQTLQPQGINTNSIPQFFTWGDSLSDSGNVYGIGKYINPPIFYPPPPYYLGHFSNGQAFAEQFGKFLGLSQTNIVDIIGPEIPPHTIIVPPAPQPVPYPPTAGAPPSPPIAAGQMLAYTLPIGISAAILSRGDSLPVVVTRMAALVAKAMYLDPTAGNVIITAYAPSLTGSLIFRANDNATLAYGYAAAYANPTTRSQYMMSQPDLTNLFVTSSTVSASSVAVVACGTNGYHAYDNPYCSSDVLPAPTNYDSSSSNNTPLIVGLVVGLVGGFIALLVFYFVLSWCLERAAQTRHTQKSHELTSI